MYGYGSTVRCRRTLVASLVSVGLVLAAGSARAEPSPAPSSAVAKEKALETFREGIAAFDRRDFEAARVAFLQTFALRPSEPVVRRNLGLAEIYSGHYLEGARRLSRVLHTTSEGDAQARSRMLESLQKAEAHLERLTLEVDVDGADIVVDGVHLGQSPLAFAWYLAPGNYDVRVERSGYQLHEQRRVAIAGSRHHLRIHLEPLVEPVEAAPSAPPLSVAPRDEVAPARLSVPWLVAGAAVTVAGIVSGTTFALHASDNEKKGERLRGSIGEVGCAQAASPATSCSALESALEQHDRQEIATWVSFGVAGAVGLSTLTYALLADSPVGPSPSASAEGLQWRASLGAEGASVVVRGVF